MKHLFKAGDVVNIFQLSGGKGLILEGRATVAKPIGNPQDEHYMVRFHRKNGEMEIGSYERFIDREGQTDPEAYIKAFNKKIGYAA